MLLESTRHIRNVNVKHERIFGIKFNVIKIDSDN